MYEQQRPSSGSQRRIFPPEDPPTYQEVSDEEDGFESSPGMGVAPQAEAPSAMSSRREAVLASVEARMQRIGVSAPSNSGVSMALLGAEEDDWGRRSQARHSNASSSRQSPPISPLTDQVKQMQQYLRRQDDGRRFSQESRMMQQPPQQHQSILHGRQQQPGDERAASAHHHNHQQPQQHCEKEDIQRRMEQEPVDEARALMEKEQRRMQERERQRAAEAETRMLEEQNALHR